VAATKMNSASSRSHAALIVRVTTTGGVRTLNGMLYLVDLAGSERVKKSGVEGAAFDEAKAINQSLTTLGRCIEVLASNKKEKPPFRESKLTRLLSNAIGGAAKTTLVVCVAPTMTDQFETTNSLDFGQQAMNVVVRAKVNASTDYGSLTASLLLQRDKKQRPIREVEAKVLRELTPQLDEVVRLEMACKAAALDVEFAEERVDAAKDDLARAKAAGDAEEEAGKGKMAELLNERAKRTEELEKVLLELSTDPEMKQIQEEHEKEKSQTTVRTNALAEELRTSEHRELLMRKSIDERLEGVVHTARNLGQIAAYFLQAGEMDEAASFYQQAKAIFDDCLGPDHETTQQWQQDLFFLVNAPAIQQMVASTAKTLAPDSEAAAQGDDPWAKSAPDWWLNEMTLFAADKERCLPGELEDDDAAAAWWMQNLYGNTGAGNLYAHAKGDGVTDEELDYMQILFGTPREGTTTPRGGAAFTPRGTLAALSQANGKSGAAISLGMPLNQKATPAADAPQPSEAVNMSFASQWIERVFLTPRDASAGESGVDNKEMADAVAWLNENFGGSTPRGAEAAMAAAVTPRGTASSSAAKQAADAVLHAAMKATLATPRGTAEKAVDDTPMADALSKSFDASSVFFNGRHRQSV